MGSSIDSSRQISQMRQKRGSVADKEDPRVLRTRKLLQDAFIELMGDHSFESITVQDITDTAQVNHATFYRHYQDKYHLADAIFAEALDSMLRAFGPPRSLLEVDKTDSTVILKSWGIIFKHVADNDRLYRTLFSSSSNALFIRRIREHFASVVKERMEARIKQNKPTGARGGGVKKPNYDIPYAIAANLFIGTIGWWLEEGQKYDLDQVIVWTRKIMHDGFGELLRD
ncbi:MAG: TetR/AcrR family transcriptional regulator [Spirochaetia bacterium]|jgi:AcrR family transcriptional regulator